MINKIIKYVFYLDNHVNVETKIIIIVVFIVLCVIYLLLTSEKFYFDFSDKDIENFLITLLCRGDIYDNQGELIMSDSNKYENILIFRKYKERNRIGLDMIIRENENFNVLKESIENKGFRVYRGKLEMKELNEERKEKFKKRIKKKLWKSFTKKYYDEFEERFGSGFIGLQEEDFYKDFEKAFNENFDEFYDLATNKSTKEQLKKAPVMFNKGSFEILFKKKFGTEFIKYFYKELRRFNKKNGFIIIRLEDDLDFAKYFILKILGNYNNERRSDISFSFDNIKKDCESCIGESRFFDNKKIPCMAIKMYESFLYKIIKKRD